MRDESCNGVIQSAWESNTAGTPMDNLIQKIDGCQTKLQAWSRMHFGNICRSLAEKKKLLAQAEAISKLGGNHEQVKILRGEVYELMVKENCLWQQRSRVRLNSGDLNTSYFHSRATHKNLRNFISKLVLDDGASVEDE